MFSTKKAAILTSKSKKVMHNDQKLQVMYTHTDNVSANTTQTLSSICFYFEGSLIMVMSVTCVQTLTNNTYFVLRAPSQSVSIPEHHSAEEQHPMPCPQHIHILQSITAY